MPRARRHRCCWNTSTPRSPPTSKLSASPPPTTTKNRFVLENQLGLVYDRAGDTGQALRHYQRALQHAEARADIYGAGITRHNIAILLAGHGRISDALLYARAARHNFQQSGPGAATDVADAERLIAACQQLNL